MKTPWIILILTFPILGVALYFMIGMNGGTSEDADALQKD